MNNFNLFFRCFISLCFVYTYKFIYMKPSTILKMIHKNCRNNIYPSSNVTRFTVPDEKVFWGESFPEYNPPSFSAHTFPSKPWVDPDTNDTSFNFKWNELDKNVNRISFEGEYSIDSNNCPLNIFGRTGLKGRGLLGRWGPNHAADPIVTRWKRDENDLKVINISTDKPILQFVGIQRRDTGDWAIPGGMVDPGEKVAVTLIREFMEEALNSLEKNKDEIKVIEDLVKQFFQKGEEIYKGYVDDPRNTDNSWMETVAFNFHDESSELIGKFNLQAGDDAKKVKWIDISNDLHLYASHKDFIIKTAQKRGAHVS